MLSDVHDYLILEYSFNDGQSNPPSKKMAWLTILRVLKNR